MVTCKEMKEIEYLADKNGLSYLEMMENAGRSAFNALKNRMSLSGKRVAVFCGKGNNGGDGFVVARLLSKEGSFVEIFLTDGIPSTKGAMANYLPDTKDDLPETFDYDIIIDGIYGTGFHGTLEPATLGLFTRINKSKAFVLSLDLPSGLAGDNIDSPIHTCIKANLTVTFHDTKPIHHNNHAEESIGELVIGSIGI